MPKLSIIIVTYNSEELIVPCLKSIFETVAGLDLEVIIIDNNSQDRSAWAVKYYIAENPENSQRIRLIENKENVGFARAVNQGIKMAQGKFVLFLNPDMRVLNGAIKTSIEFLEQNAKTGVVGGQLLYPDTLKPQPSFGNFPSYFTEFLYAFGLHKIFPCGRFISKNIFSGGKFKKTHKTDWVSGGFMMVKREAFDKVGLLDENFFMYLEDIDFCYRARQAGFEIYYFPKVKVLHHHMASSKADLSKPMIYEAKSLLYYFKKRHKNIDFLKFLIKLRYNLRLMVYFLPSLFNQKYKELFKANKKVKEILYVNKKL